MKSSTIYTVAAINAAINLLGVSAFTTTTTSKTLLPIQKPTSPTNSQRQMFGGAGSPPSEDDEEDAAKEAEIEAAAKAMGFSATEYKLVLRMQQNLANAVNSLRASGGSDEKGVTVELDGNSPPGHLVVSITEAAKESLGKEGLEKELVVALKEASEKAKKGQQEAVKNMNAEIAQEMKKMGMA
mmetsp:Transcript_65554/g.77621  ORF Transcript_65554/g.77621 Transcript_65554/m.77621 type:complete len:184 (+) Transcript_65554:178-729(+)|eukprot:CAMPEP_0172494044 /NCGR_PEP_ID=MMETSP1066-20121228/36848_1 /TAXON_ID=671091 /ORGANISM="Coscinodiscus wailesii, Strain CCMP2513" /LENGTH=183 /DNA_ID=CAMNT_0013264657 /DNA_START=178 /DNA_END=729 /DNA_ORIENTATION=+